MDLNGNDLELYRKGVVLDKTTNNNIAPYLECDTNQYIV